MLLKDLISKLQEIYDKEVDEEYLQIMGEPEIMIDTFKKDLIYSGYGFRYNYDGLSKDIEIDRSSDGVYLIISRIK